MTDNRLSSSQRGSERRILRRPFVREAILKAAPFLTLVSIVLFAGLRVANATMPILTEAPDPANLKTCTKWASAQNDEAVSMWGIQGNGQSSADIATLRLALSCLGDMPPDIVGFGSSSGFDDAYCEGHSDEKVCDR